MNIYIIEIKYFFTLYELLCFLKYMLLSVQNLYDTDDFNVLTYITKALFFLKKVIYIYKKKTSCLTDYILFFSLLFL